MPMRTSEKTVATAAWGERIMPTNLSGIGSRFTAQQIASATAMPMDPLRIVMKKPSMKNWRSTAVVVAPSAFLTPISRVRSFTAMSMMFITPIPPSASVMKPTVVKKFRIVSTMRPNISEFTDVSHIHIASLSSGSKPLRRASTVRTSFSSAQSMSRMAPVRSAS
jgi:hypothetical protein